MKKAIRVIVPLLLAITIIITIGWYLSVYDRVFTRDMLLNQARFQDTHGNSRLSSWFYNMAYSFSGHDEDVAIELANQYISSGNFTKAERTLAKAIRSTPTANLYTALSKVFVVQDKLLDAVKLLNNISDPTIKADIDSKRPSPPVSNHTPGYYSDYLDISLSSSADAIFYTTDGDFPSIAASPFRDPISLPVGVTSIQAIGVNNSGLVSSQTTLEYTVAGVVEEVFFVDAALDAAVRQLIHVNPGSPIYSNQLWDITEFTAPDGAAVFVDLAKLTYLKKLTIQNHPFDSLSFLSSLTRLQSLDLTGCSFPSEDLSVIASLPSLTQLTLSECNISSIAGLEGANQLTYLDLGGNTVRNLDSLSAMTGLTELNLQHNAVAGLDALATLPNLEKLNLSFNAVTDISPLVSCMNLRWLDIGNNQVSQLITVGNMPQLTYFSAEYNELTDVSPLAACTNLTNLNIGSNSVSDISSLRTLTKLEVFDFSANQVSRLPDWPDGSALRTVYGSYNAVTNIDILGRMPSISYVYMDYNLITNVDALADCYTLVQVNVFGNKIADVSALRAHDIIVNYDPTIK